MCTCIRTRPCVCLPVKAWLCARVYVHAQPHAHVYVFIRVYIIYQRGVPNSQVYQSAATQIIEHYIWVHTYIYTRNAYEVYISIRDTYAYTYTRGAADRGIVVRMPDASDACKLFLFARSMSIAVDLTLPTRSCFEEDSFRLLICWLETSCYSSTTAPECVTIHSQCLNVISIVLTRYNIPGLVEIHFKILNTMYLYLY